MICTAANALWLSACLPEAARFRRAVRQVGCAQMRLLHRLVRGNAATAFGRRHGFASIDTMRDYQARVPIRSYDEYEADINRMADGQHAVLTRDDVRLFEPTSGSASATKLIPYTASLQREFQRGIAPWIANLFLDEPDLMRGPAYWSISPLAGAATRTSGGIPIGFDDDASYVGGWRRPLVDAVMAVPKSVARAGREAFQYQTLLGLVRSADLRLISVWNPSFLAVLVGRLPAFADAILDALQGDSHRSATLRDALRARTAAERHAILWPRLRLISCWTDANAASAAAALRALFPHSRFQGKGLLATEGFVSLPLRGHDGAALSVRSHVFEFAPLDSQGRADEGSPLLAHELERDRRYTVILSTGGGLYRYRLNDVIEVVGHIEQCPMIRFVGKHEYVSDWFGEKLHEAHVALVLRDAIHSAGAHAAFAMLACDTALAPPAYVLYVDSPSDDAPLARAADLVEQGLRRSFHYDCARLIGQLGSVRTFRAQSASETYLSAAVSAGQRAGNVKPLALDRRDGWSRRFGGRFIPSPSQNTPCDSAPSRLVR